MSNAGNEFVPADGTGEIDFNATLHLDDGYRPLDKYKVVENESGSEFKSRGRRNKKSESMAGIVDRYFRKKISIPEGGATTSMTILEAIWRALYLKSLAGNKRALRALDLYSRFGSDGPRPERRVMALYEFEGAHYRVIDEEGEV